MDSIFQLLKLIFNTFQTNNYLSGKELKYNGYNVISFYQPIVAGIPQGIKMTYHDNFTVIPIFGLNIKDFDKHNLIKYVFSLEKK